MTHPCPHCKSERAPEPTFLASELHGKITTVFLGFALGQAFPGMTDIQGTFLEKNFLEGHKDGSREIFDLRTALC